MFIKVCLITSAGLRPPLPGVVAWSVWRYSAQVREPALDLSK